jgi:hypothetical protein
MLTKISEDRRATPKAFEAEDRLSVTVNKGIRKVLFERKF